MDSLIMERLFFLLLGCSIMLGVMGNQPWALLFAIWSTIALSISKILKKKSREFDD